MSHSELHPPYTRESCGFLKFRAQEIWIVITTEAVPKNCEDQQESCLAEPHQLCTNSNNIQHPLFVGTYKEDAIFNPTHNDTNLKLNE